MSTLREAMCAATERGAREGKPNCYYWSAVWLRLHSRQSANPAEFLRSSKSQRRLFWDMKNRPEHYTSWKRPAEVSDWQWSGLADSASGHIERKHKRTTP